jgi:SRSO17 transposase
LIREKSPRLRNAEGPKNTFSELVAEKQLKYSEHKVAHHAAGTHGLAILLPSSEWSTVQRVRVTIQRVRATWRFIFPPAALYKQTGWCEVTTTFIAIALLCC